MDECNKYMQYKKELANNSNNQNVVSNNYIKKFYGKIRTNNNTIKKNPLNKKQIILTILN